MTALVTASLQRFVLYFSFRNQVQHSTPSMAALSLLVALALVFGRCHGQPYPFMNTSISFKDRVKVRAMTNVATTCAIIVVVCFYYEFPILLILRL